MTSEQNIALFTELGDALDRRWREREYDEAVFPKLAAEALVEFDLVARVDAWDIVRWVHETPRLPQQLDLDADFGDPPITLYVGPEFYIDVYFWLDGTTSIHQHAFSGAFQVLLGSSVHSSYSFEKQREINPHFLTGKISLREVGLLKHGDVREINAGPEFIHSLFHLERPSATITIRTFKSSNAVAQFRYQKPFIAYDPFFEDASLKRRVQTTELLLRTKHPDADDLISRLIGSSDFQTAYEVLKKAYQFLCHRELEAAIGVTRSADRIAQLFDSARAKHGELVDLLVPVYEEDWRQDEITRLRGSVKREEHRFFLALLLNVPERAAILRLVRDRYPDSDPIALVVNWLKELSATRVFGSSAPNVLGVGFRDEDLFVFQGLLEGLSEEEIKGRAAATPLIGARELPVAELAGQLKTMPLFKSILAAQG